jgi:oligopeptide/dipeptide ABC transporter ATP-binding protein
MLAAWASAPSMTGSVTPFAVAIPLVVIRVMYLGKIVEYAPVRAVFHQPLHPYTVGLLNSVPVLGKKTKKALVPITGMVPSPTEHIQGCAFASRCPQVMAICREKQPPLKEAEEGHQVACWLHT